MRILRDTHDWKGEQMMERPILFKAEMVISTLEDRKTQTRRLPGLEYVNSYPGSFVGDGAPFGDCGYKGLAPSSYFIKDKKDYDKNPGLYHWFLGRQEREINPIPVKCFYGAVGDRLWVRETWYSSITETENPDSVCYRADDEMLSWFREKAYKWKPSIFMPRWASRITLEIVSVRCERLQNITEADAIAEGITDSFPEVECDSYRDGYRILWNTINGAGSWDANPWVWLVEFKRLSTAQA